MEEKILEQLVEFVQTASPVVWEAARRQVYVWTVQWSIAFLVLAGLGAYLGRLVLRFKEDRDGDMALFFGLWAASAFGGALLILGRIVGQLINPDYYAIKALLELVP